MSLIKETNFEHCYFLVFALKSHYYNLRINSTSIIDSTKSSFHCHDLTMRFSIYNVLHTIYLSICLRSVKTPSSVISSWLNSTFGLSIFGNPPKFSHLRIFLGLLVDLGQHINGRNRWNMILEFQDRFAVSGNVHLIEGVL